MQLQACRKYILLAVSSVTTHIGLKLGVGMRDLRKAETSMHDGTAYLGPFENNFDHRIVVRSYSGDYGILSVITFR